MTFIDEIYDFNLRAGLLDNPYNDFLESSFQIEEALEGFNSLDNLVDLLSKSHLPLIWEDSPKNISRGILGVISNGEVQTLTDVERLDKAIDALVFAVGSMAKLKLTPEQITKAISVVTQANLQKLSMPKDEFGKLQKPADFISPEAQLQVILDERKL